MMNSTQAMRRRRLSLALGTSTLAWGLAFASAAQAQCAPDPPVQNGTTTCTGTDANGIRVTTTGTTLTVASGATVLGSSAPAVAVDVPKAAYTFVTNRINVLGQIVGGTQTGIVAYTGGPATAYNSTQTLALTVGAGAAVSGTTALSLLNTPGSYQALVASIDNAGTLSGTAGTALSGNATTSTGGTVTSIGGFSAITNRTTGVITGGITGPIGTLSNAGTINGGTGSAIDTSVAAPSSSANSPSSGLWTNSGTIRSTSNSSTILIGSVGGFGFTITNSGAIQNAGVGTAINTAAATVAITNLAGGQISSTGATAITGTAAISLVNRGLITGNIVTAAGASTIDSSQGTVTGSVMFGAGNDTLIARYNGSRALATGITGTANGGAGTNTEQVVFDTDTSVNTPVDLATNFQQLGLAPAGTVTVTLQPGFQTAAPVLLVGSGSVVNRGTIAVAGQTAVTTATTSPFVFTNAGTISMSGATAPFALTFSTYAAPFSNNGMISSSGGGVSAGVVALNNSGTITAAGTAASIGNTVTNSGTIRSTGGVGVMIGGQTSYSQSINSGTISGTTSGAIVTNSQLVNDGLVTGGATGVALGYSGTLVNDISGVVSGGSNAVTNTAYTVNVLNAGLINGNVNLVSSLTYDSSNDVFVDNGGMVNGAIRLGGGDDLLVVDLASNPNRPLAGATGGVDAGSGYDTLRFRVNADASANLVLPSGFEALSYELDNKAALTLTATSPLSTTIGLTGNGTVTLNGAISSVDRTLIDTTILTVAQLTAGRAGPTQALSIVNNGNLSLTTVQSNNYTPLAAVYAREGSTFTNNGTIAVSSAAGSYYPGIAVFGGATVTNAGTITLAGGATAISGAQAAINSGIISDTPGSGGRGIANVATLTNSGTIRVDSDAVQVGKLNNSGTLVSRRGTAVQLGSTLTNEATGTIQGAIAAVSMSGGSVLNRGTIIGNVTAAANSSGSNIYVADGGTVAGNVSFGLGYDIFLQTGTGGTGVSGMIDGGGGTQDAFGYALTSSDTVSLDPHAQVINFENALVLARGADTAATITASAPFAGTVFVGGDGTVLNRATLTGGVLTYLPYGLAGVLPGYGQSLANLDNEGTIAGSIQGSITGVVNNGTISGGTSYGDALALYNSGPVSVTNKGQITMAGDSSGLAVNIQGSGLVSVSNEGKVTGGVDVRNNLADVQSNTLAFTNLSSITSSVGSAVEIAVGPNYFPSTIGSGGTISVSNTGTIASTAAASGAFVSGLYLEDIAGGVGVGYTIANAGTISASAPTGGARSSTAFGIEIFGDIGLTGTITNAAGGIISSTGDRAFAVFVADSAISLVNAGTISAIGSTTSVAVQALDAFANTVRNTGVIIGDVRLADGVDTVDNAGRITGNVSLGAGEDSFTQRAGSTVSGLVDGGDGNDRYLVDTTGGATTLAAGQIANFERVTQTGTGTGVYSGTFGVDTVNLAGGTLSVAAGQTLATTGATTVTGIAGSGNLSVINAGKIAGGITFADGKDEVVNTGAIGGRVQFGSGDDTYTEGVGSSVGSVDGGAGTNLYRVVLAGDRSSIGARSNFQNLAVDGTGTLALTLDQSFQSIALTGTNLALALGTYTVGQITATGPATQLMLDRDVGAVQLGAGNDTLAIGAVTLAGRYDGGAGTDTLRLTNTGAVTLSGTATGFETVALTGALTISGTLGSPGQALAITGGDKSLTVARGGVLAGTIDLGAGNDSFRLAAGGTLAGSVSGGAGTNSATLDLSAADLTLRPATLTNFQRLTTEGAGALTLAGGGFAYDTVTASGNLTVAADASLAARIAFGPADNRLVIAGGFTGAVDGGAGNDSIDVSGGSATAPVAFSTIGNVEAYRMNGGFATVSGTAALGSVTLTGGRLVGLAGSSMTAASFTVGQGATFGSAGTVNGNVAVAGTLSPGASPGTMTVNGNVSLASGSTSLFEITPTVSDKLVVNGAVSIANGATLQLLPSGTLRPGTSYDLIVASGGITGGFTTVIKPDTLFGFIAQRADRIQLLGQFLALDGGAPQVNRSIAYANATLAAQPATSALFGALPALLTAGGASNAQAFARLTPEPYASATQLGVDNALTLVDTARGPSFATTGEGVHAYTFAATLGQWHQLGDDTATGASATRTQGYGFLGGVGFGSAAWSVGAFGGYLNDRQRIDALGAQTKADGLIAGVHGRIRSASGLGLSASVLYDGGTARTTRALPTGPSAAGRYDLHSIVSDVQLSYEVATSAGWALRPHAGITYLRITRDGVTETGGSPFALTVARDRNVAGFADAGVFFGRGDASPEPFRPWVSFGARYQTQGMQTDALAGYADGGLGLEALGASRSRAVGTAAGGFAYRLQSGLDLFASASSQTGTDDHQESISAGARLRF